MARKQMKRKRKIKTERQKLTAKLDGVVREIVRNRDDWTCQHCGKKFDRFDHPSLRAAHTAHIVGKGGGGFRFRWDLLDVILLCHHCHIDIFHRSGKGLEDWIRERFPARAEYLDGLKALGPLRMTDTDIAEKLAQYKEKLEELND